MPKMRKEILRKPAKRPPSSVRSNYEISHPQLSSSNRKYLWKIAAVYSSRNMKILKDLQNMELLRHQIKLGFHSREQYENYINHLNKQRLVPNDRRGSARPHTAPPKTSNSSPRRATAKPTRVKKSGSKSREDARINGARKKDTTNARNTESQKVEEEEENKGKEGEMGVAEDEETDREDLEAQPIDEAYDDESFEIISDDGTVTLTSLDDDGKTISRKEGVTRPKTSSGRKTDRQNSLDVGNGSRQEDKQSISNTEVEQEDGTSNKEQMLENESSNGREEVKEEGDENEGKVSRKEDKVEENDENTLNQKHLNSSDESSSTSSSESSRSSSSTSEEADDKIEDDYEKTKEDKENKRKEESPFSKSSGTNSGGEEEVKEEKEKKEEKEEEKEEEEEKKGEEEKKEQENVKEKGEEEEGKSELHTVEDATLQEINSLTGDEEMDAKSEEINILATSLVEDVLEESLREIKKDKSSNENHLNLMDSFERDYFKKVAEEEKLSNSDVKGEILEEKSQTNNANDEKEKENDEVPSNDVGKNIVDKSISKEEIRVVASDVAKSLLEESLSKFK